MSQDRFFDLVSLVLTTLWNTCNPQFYHQTDSVECEDQGLQPSPKYRYNYRYRENCNIYGIALLKSFRNVS